MYGMVGGIYGVYRHESKNEGKKDWQEDIDLGSLGANWGGLLSGMPYPYGMIDAVQGERITQGIVNSLID